MTKGAEAALLETQTLWKEVRPGTDQRLVRLALLRKLANQLHTELSECMGNPESLLSLRHAIDQLIEQIEILRSKELSCDDLRDLLSHPDQVQLVERALSQEVGRSVGIAKLFRHDRKWEAALCAEAEFCGWSFFELSAVLELAQVEKWHRELIKTLWPDSFVLFVESADSPSGSWRGAWTLISRPGVRPNIPSAQLKIIFEPKAQGVVSTA